MNLVKNWSLQSLKRAPSSNTLVERERGAAMYKITRESTLSTKMSIEDPMPKRTTPAVSHEKKNGKSEMSIYRFTTSVLV